MKTQNYPSLKLEDLRLGMKVRDYQLSGIQGYYILLSDVIAEYEGIQYFTEGVIRFIGAKQDSEYNDIHRKLKEQGSKMHIIINSEEECAAYEN